jgi:hypothetical protein
MLCERSYDRILGFSRMTRPQSLRNRVALQLNQHEVAQSDRITLAVLRVFDDLLGDNRGARVGAVNDVENCARIVIRSGKSLYSLRIKCGRHETAPSLQAGALTSLSHQRLGSRPLPVMQQSSRHCPGFSSDTFVSRVSSSRSGVHTWAPAKRSRPLADDGDHVGSMVIRVDYVIRSTGRRVLPRSLLLDLTPQQGQCVQGSARLNEKLSSGPSGGGAGSLLSVRIGHDPITGRHGSGSVSWPAIVSECEAPPAWQLCSHRVLNRK